MLKLATHEYLERHEISPSLFLRLQSASEIPPDPPLELPGLERNLREVL